MESGRHEKETIVRSVLNHEALIATVTIVVENDTVVETRWSGVCGGHVEGNGRRLPFRWLKFLCVDCGPKNCVSGLAAFET